MSEFPLLTLTIFLPLVGAVLVFMINGEEEIVARNARNVALWTSGMTFALSLLLWLGFDERVIGFQFVQQTPWIPTFGITYHVGIDGISLFLILLTTFLTPLCILASWDAIKDRVKEYMVAFLFMETTMIGVFSALDFVLFYVFFEAMLVPMFLIIGVWGGPGRIYATFKFFLFTLAGSVLLLLAILAMYLEAGTTDVPTLMNAEFDFDMQRWLWVAMFASFAVKVPMWPVHTWLPDAHVEAPTAGSMVLAGVLLKIGGYGFLRFSLPMLPEATVFFTPLIYTLSVVAVIYTSLVALAQEDMKKLIAYSSVAHMGFVTIGIFTLNTQGIEGAILVMLSHGFVSAALFFCVGVVYERVHSRMISRYGGLVHRMPVYAFCFMVFTLASVGLPGTSGFVGEFLSLVGAYQANTWVAALATIGIILGPAYMLWLYRRVVFGKLTKPDLVAILDCNRREILTFAPMVALVIIMGVYPELFLSAIRPSVANLIAQTVGTATDTAALIP